MKISILMATYNGEKYIAEQLESIRNQSIVDWELLIRDDQSTDNTVAILNNYEILDSRIKVVKDNKGNLGQLKNFSELCSLVTDSEIVFFADQDDIWYMDKLAVTIEKYKTLTNPYKMIYTNFILWNEKSNNKKVAYESNIPLQENLLVQNWVYGCTMAISGEICHLIKNIPEEAKNHDNWIANVAALYGEIGYINEPTMDHRLHEYNVTNTNKNKPWDKFCNFVALLKEKKVYIENKKIFVDKLIEIGEYQNITMNYLTVFDFKKLINTSGISAIRKFRELKLTGFSKFQSFLFCYYLL